MNGFGIMEHDKDEKKNLSIATMICSSFFPMTAGFPSPESNLPNRSQIACSPNNDGFKSPESDQRLAAE
uniref:Uncharacterized protein n=1 Tax=Romanomermis culicivorax TaxID=13658 RepID=A0A915JIA6_ROMCU